MGSLTLSAPAKVNLYLEVCGRDNDDRHRLETIFLTVDLADRITLSDEGTGIHLQHRGPSWIRNALPDADQDNLAWRAAMAWFTAAGRTPRLSITLEKHIPIAAGLGGGSSDAAAVLRGLQALHSAPLDTVTLTELARKLGADVPFFLHGGCAYGDRHGDRISPITGMPPYALTIIQADCACSTAAVFAALHPHERQGAARGRTELEHSLRRDPPGLLFNRLAAAARRLHPPVDQLLRWLTDRNLPHCLSGSGSCCLVWGHHQAPRHLRSWHVRSLP